ncbi:MAG: metal ABC transporter ATP-binding protein [Planctomycetota bacterium]
MSADTAALAAFRAADFGYDDECILAGVEWEIHAGEWWSVIGPNGAGKTTLLRGLLGLLRPFAGRVELAPDIASRRGLAFVPQLGGVADTVPTTPREVVSLGLAGLRLTRRERDQRTGEALAQVGLEAHARRSFHTLSGGQKQRVLVARGLARRPRLLVMDEPTAGVDRPSELALLAGLHRLRETDALTVVLVTHSFDHAFRHATHTALVGSGMVRCGAGRSALTADAVTGVFGEPMDVLR